MADMCPHCGDLVTCGEDGLTPYHDWPRPTRQVCPGSKQHPRCAEGDARPLWTGEANPHFDHDGKLRDDMRRIREMERSADRDIVVGGEADDQD